MLLFHLYFTEEQLVYNVHSLLHLVADWRLYGPCYEFSFYKFENELSNIRGMVRSKNRLFAQIFNRCTENLVYNPENYYVNRNQRMKIAPNDQDSYFILDDGIIVRIESVVANGGYSARIIDRVKVLFEFPVRSSLLDIYICKLGCSFVKITRDSIKCK